ncbi:MAG: DNA repair protein RadC [Bacteroidales bacterium]|jgi:DNA repair protein RadC|nr:DNA repair protein RadC [Bacteroidales bacterium]
MGKSKAKNDGHQSFPITDWAEEDRPREKLVAKGVASLSNAELLAIIMRSGSPEDNAVELARKILADFKNNLAELGKATVAQLKNYRGMGEVKAISIIAGLELGRRRNISEVIEKKTIMTSMDIFMLFHPMLSDLPHEEFWILFLNSSNRYMDMQRLSIGGLADASADVRLIMKMAIERLAACIVLCHNHPSGSATPSKQDISVTRKVKEGGALLNITLLDHVIVADNSYYSFADEGALS